MNRELGRSIKKIKLVAFDFDGVFTDGKVILSQDGIESVVCSRKDSLGVHLLKQAGLKVVVISNELNPIVARRCQRIGVECYQTREGKLPILKRVLKENSFILSEAAFMGDDVNDLDCLLAVGLAITVADCHQECKKVAHYVTVRNGGDHAVREVCDLILKYSKPA